MALGLLVPGAYGDCETVFDTSAEEPYLTVGDVTLGKRRPNVRLGWHEYPGVSGPQLAATGVVELRYRGRVIARGRFAGFERPTQRAVALRLDARGRRLACRSARTVRLLVVATARAPAPLLINSRRAIRRGARLPRVGTCAERR